jgi:hypothetical protein
LKILCPKFLTRILTDWIQFLHGSFTWMYYKLVDDGCCNDSICFDCSLLEYVLALQHFCSPCMVLGIVVFRDSKEYVSSPLLLSCPPYFLKVEDVAKIHVSTTGL